MKLVVLLITLSLCSCEISVQDFVPEIFWDYGLKILSLIILLATAIGSILAAWQPWKALLTFQLSYNRSNSTTTISMNVKNHCKSYVVFWIDLDPYFKDKQGKTFQINKFKEFYKKSYLGEQKIEVQPMFSYSSKDDEILIFISRILKDEYNFDSGPAFDDLVHVTDPILFFKTKFYYCTTFWYKLNYFGGRIKFFRTIPRKPKLEREYYFRVGKLQIP